MPPPAYFERVRSEASSTEDLLESNPRIRGPWRELFKQIQSPRHVLSELLQNADDAKAKTASVHIEDYDFIFEHDGVDFTEEHFYSLCSFAFSNKRNLFTIGFRGIGFKSVFSLGDEIYLTTPTLAVCFRKDRFTEPQWLSPERFSHLTQVRVRFKEESLRQELQKNLREWTNSPLSLLFFRNIQTLSIQGTRIDKASLGHGPVKHSELVTLSPRQKEPYLLIRSEPYSFPEKAKEEIREERVGSEDMELPPCQIELVVGLPDPQKIYVVLPTGVDTTLPLCINAPFVQDPARVKIKDPNKSPTNKWLLEKAGELAAEAMLEWLRQGALSNEERCEAYKLLPRNIANESDSIEYDCSSICEASFDKIIAKEKYILTEDDVLVGRKECIAVPLEIYDIWKPELISQLLDDEKRPLLCRHVFPPERRKLNSRDAFDDIGKNKLLDALEYSSQVLRPDTGGQLLLLWDYLYEDIEKEYTYGHSSRNNARIVPVQGSEELHKAVDVVRLGEEGLLSNNDDFEFLSRHMMVLNGAWPKYLADKLNEAIALKDKVWVERAEHANKLLSVLNLAEACSGDRVIELVTNKFFDVETELEDCVRLAQVAAALKAVVPPGFKFIAIDGTLVSLENGVISDVLGDKNNLMEKTWRDAHMLNTAYRETFVSCSEFAWNSWIASEKSQLLAFVPLVKTSLEVEGTGKMKRMLEERGVAVDDFPYKSRKFIFEDWDFGEEQWSYWESLAKDNQNIWGMLTTLVLEIGPRHWEHALYVRAIQKSHGNKIAATDKHPTSAWIMKFRSLPCLQDTHGEFREPAELLLRNRSTEALMGVEYFISTEFDTDANRPLLLAMGVRETPTGIEPIIDRLRDLSKEEEPSLAAIGKWYGLLEQILQTPSNENSKHVIETFATERLIFSAENGWASSKEVALTTSPDQPPVMPTVHPYFRQMTLWQMVGVKPASDEVVLDWLRNLQDGQKLKAADLGNVKSAITRFPSRVWIECKRWLNLEGEWTDTSKFSYCLYDHGFQVGHLDQDIRIRTADFRWLPIEQRWDEALGGLMHLDQCVVERISRGNDPSLPRTIKPWLEHLGHGLERIDIDDEERLINTQTHAARMAATRWVEVEGLEVIPYIDENPIGKPRKPKVMWDSMELFVEGNQLAQLFNAVSEELARPFNDRGIADSIKACIDRDTEFIDEYLKMNFGLLTGPAPSQPKPPLTTPATGDEVHASGSNKSKPDFTEIVVVAPKVTDKKPPSGSYTSSQKTSDDSTTSNDLASGEVPESEQAPKDKRSEHIAMKAVMDKERGEGRQPKDVSADNLGYDIESYSEQKGMTYFIEVKGRVAGAATVTVTVNEIRTALSSPDQYILAIVEVSNNEAKSIVYVWNAFNSKPDYAAAGVIYNIERLKSAGSKV